MSVFGVKDDGSLRFTETEAKEVKLTPFQWSRSCKLSDNWFARYRTKDGVSNLGDMALRSVIKNRHGLTADVLSDVDWEPVGKRIWEEIKAKCEEINLFYLPRANNIVGKESQSLSGRSLQLPMQTTTLSTRISRSLHRLCFLWICFPILSASSTYRNISS